MYELDEETQEQKFTEDFAIPPTEELKNIENWCHVQPILLKVGRCTHVEPEGLPDEEKDEYMAKLADEDKTEERFRTIMEDSKINKQPSWSSKICGDQQTYNKPGGEGTISYSVNVIKSTRWPGALTVARNGKFMNLYIGDGIRNGQLLFSPTEPPQIEKDPFEPIEEPEPNGKDPVVKAAAAEDAEEDE